MLSQANHPIAFFSKKLSERARKRSAYAREMLAITEAVAKFRHYLSGHYFIIRTDQKSLHHLTNQTIQTPDQEEWLPKLLGFRFSIEYKPGNTNVVADALSRSFYMALSSPVFTILDDIREAIVQDKELLAVKAACLDQPLSRPPYSVRDDTLFWKGRIVIPQNAVELKQQLLLEYHSSPVGGHAGVYRTFRRLAAIFFWP